jgi:hypothetical protein
MIIYIVLLVFVAIVTFLLLTPIVLEIDSSRRKYGLYVKGIVGLEMLFEHGRLLFLVRTWGWTRRIDPFRASTKRPANGKQSRRRKWHVPLRKVRHVLGSFHLQYLYVELDTGDYITNAYLVPLAELLRQYKRRVRINFHGDNVVRLRVTNNAGRMLLAYLR